MKERSGWQLSKSNRRGVSILLLLLLIIVFIPRLISSFEGDTFQYTSDLVDQASMLKNESEASNHFRKSNFKKKGSNYKVPKSKFDPNTYSKENWMHIGLSEKQVNVVMRFTERGVYSLEDIQRIFVIPPKLYELIKDSLVFPKRNEFKQSYQTTKYEKKKVVFELNTASKEQLLDLPGIGDYIAERIIAYRDRLGGFNKKEQLLEIKKIELDLYNKIEDQLTVDANSLKKLNVNLADAEMLKAHPYMNWNIANSIVKMRIQKGGTYKTKEELMESVLIDRELFEKIKPYVSL